MWKTSKEIKNHGPTTDQKCLLWKTKTEYKVLPNSSLPILPEQLDWHLSISASHLHLLQHTWSPHQAWSWPFLESTQVEKWVFTQTQIVSKLRYERMNNQPIFFSRKFIENSLENNRKVGFSWQPNIPN